MVFKVVKALQIQFHKYLRVSFRNSSFQYETRVWNYIIIYIFHGGAGGVMVIAVGNGHGDTSSKTDCISHSTNTFGGKV